ncbi:hypothetical protein BU204_20750 [Actinophytocola xanthii]|uniref:Uncharacterized protein n=1 Tax=Actinophytocola xanthii TaxID=1912961 RepID=A0A1Q8CMU3_9PSEU|nr:hypothetical protein BU204_20750 [Actinophytocola xanthii]
MPVPDRLFLALLVFDAAVLAVVELVFLPLSFDGYLLPNLDGFPLPLTQLVAAVTTPLLVARAGELSPRPLVASAPLVAWIVVVAGVGLFGPGGDVLLTADWRSLLLFACGALPSAVVLGRVLATALGGPS